MKKISVSLFLLFVLVLSACRTAKEANYQPEEGGYILKNMTEAQIEKLIEEYNIDSERAADIWEKREEGWSLIIKSDGSTLLYTVSDNDAPFDPICYVEAILNKRYTVEEHKKHLLDPSLLVIVSPNPTSSYVNVKLLSSVAEIIVAEAEIFEMYGYRYHYRSIFPMPVHFQLLYNERIIREWTNNNCNEIEVIPAEYLKERGSYLLVCHFIGPTGCTASTTASFMVIK